MARKNRNVIVRNTQKKEGEIIEINKNIENAQVFVDIFSVSCIIKINL